MSEEFWTRRAAEQLPRWAVQLGAALFVHKHLTGVGIVGIVFAKPVPDDSPHIERGFGGCA